MYLILYMCIQSSSEYMQAHEHVHVIYFLHIFKVPSLMIYLLQIYWAFIFNDFICLN